MAKLPKKAVERITAGLKRFQPVLVSAKSRDVNESDTVVIVTDLLQEVFGYDKYAEITSEHMIRSTFCDLAVKLEGTLAFLIEVKAIGHELKDQHIKQAVDYAANQGCEWVALTNGAVWKVFRVRFSKPIEHELVVDMDLLSVNPRNFAYSPRLTPNVLLSGARQPAGSRPGLVRGWAAHSLRCLILRDGRLVRLHRLRLKLAL